MVFVLRDISHRSKMILGLIYGYSKPFKKASYYTKSKGRKEESIGRVFKKAYIGEIILDMNNNFQIIFYVLGSNCESLFVGHCSWLLFIKFQPFTLCWENFEELSVAN